MNYWRMSFRVGNHGNEMWPDCLRLGVAAITYEPLSKTDLARYARDEPKSLWDKLAPAQKGNLRKVAYEMQAGDVIYVKRGPEIVDRGTITGAYRFDSRFRLRVNGMPWGAHQVPVDWSGQFTPITLTLGNAQQLTVEKLARAEVERVEAAIASAVNPGQPDTERLEEAYYRETPARLKVIIPLHNKLSNEFCRWLRTERKIRGTQEKQRVDVRFDVRGLRVVAELKICCGVGTTKSIREAIGQLLEYNHYASRRAADVWLIVLDDEPSERDKRYVGLLRDDRSLPITLGWRQKPGFSFYPRWPA